MENLPKWAKKNIQKKKKVKSKPKPLIHNGGLLYPISDLINRLDTSRTNIYNWEEKGYITPTFMEKNKRRWYSKEYIDFIVKHYQKGTDKKLWQGLWEKKQKRKAKNNEKS